MEVAESIANGVGGGGGGTERGDETVEHQPPQLEHPVLHAAGDADIEDVAHKHGPEGEGAEALQAQRQVRIGQPPENDHRRHSPGHQRGNGHPPHIHAEAEDQKGVARHVDPVHQEGYPQRHIRPLHGPEHGRAAVVEGDAGDGGGYNGVVRIGGRHDIRLHLGEEGHQNGALEEVEQERDHEGSGAQQENQVFPRAPGLPPLLPPDVLSRHRRASGGYGGEDVDHEVADGVHQGDGGDGRVPHHGHHQGVRQPHADGEELF